MFNKKKDKTKFRPDARHSEFWEDMVPMGLLVGVVFSIIGYLLDYFNIIEI